MRSRYDACAKLGPLDCDASGSLGPCNGTVRYEPGGCTSKGTYQPGTRLEHYLRERCGVQRAAGAPVARAQGTRRLWAQVC